MKIKGLKKKGEENKKSVMSNFEKITLLITILTLIANIIMVALMLRGC